MTFKDTIYHARTVREGFEVCRCPGPHPGPLVWDHHHLWPLGWDGPDVPWNLARGCPNAHRLSHTLLNAMKRNGGPLAYLVAIRFGRYPKLLAETGWGLMLEAGVSPAQALALYPDLRQ